MVKYKNNDSDLLCDVIRKMDAIQCGLWDYHDGKSRSITCNGQIHREHIYFLEKTQDRMYEAGVRHPSVQQPRPRTRSPARSPARSPGQSGLQARRRINSQPDSIIDLT